MIEADDAELAKAKADLRARMMAIRDAIAADARAERSALLAVHLDDPALRQWLPAPGAVVAGFRAIRSELDPAALLDRLAATGYALALPRVASQGLVFHRWRPGDRLVAGRFGLHEPDAAAPIVEPLLYLTPLLAFDREGGRLGYGKGYYDRVFAAGPAIPRIGLAFREQEVQRVPCGPNDVRLQAVIAV
jgi:5-formyltetrahydrofolate cyclo-ligase